MWQRKLAASDEEQCWEGHSGYWGSEGAGTWREAEPSVEEQREEEGEEFLVALGEAAWEEVLLEVDPEEGLVVGQGVGLEVAQEGDQGATYEASAPSEHQVDWEV